MSVDTATSIGGFDTALPANTDLKAEGAANIRHVKSILKTDFPNITGPVTATHSELSRLVGIGSTVTGTELGYVAGATSNLQTQINTKAATTLVEAMAFTSSLPNMAGHANEFVTTDGVSGLWSKVPLATGVSGTLPVANGGTGSTTSTGTGAVVLATSPTLVTPALGTPASGTMTNVTGLPIATGVSGLGTGVATFLATPSSANLAAAVTDETGTGSLVLGTAPSLTNPTITNYTETVYAPAAGSAFTVDWANGSYQKFTTNANITITLPAAAAGKGGTIEIYYGGTHTVTWAGGTSIRWAGGAAPTATSTTAKSDKYSFFCPTSSATDGQDGGRNF